MTDPKLPEQMTSNLNLSPSLTQNRKKKGGEPSPGSGNSSEKRDVCNVEQDTTITLSHFDSLLQFQSSGIQGVASEKAKILKNELKHGFISNEKEFGNLKGKFEILFRFYSDDHIGLKSQAEQENQVYIRPNVHEGRLLEAHAFKNTKQIHDEEKNVTIYSPFVSTTRNLGRFITKVYKQAGSDVNLRINVLSKAKYLGVFLVPKTYVLDVPDNPFDSQNNPEQEAECLFIAHLNNNKEKITLKKFLVFKVQNRLLIRRGGRGFGKDGKGSKRDQIEEWIPVTKLGRLVSQGLIENIEEVYKFSLPIKEFQIIDKLLKNKLKEEVMKVQLVQKMTTAGQRTRVKAVVLVGDYQGHLGLGIKVSKEVQDAVKGAIVHAKLNMIPIRRGYWDNKIGDPHTVPTKVTGKCGSVRVRLIPSPRGSGIIAAPAPKKVLQMAGIKDVKTSARGCTKTKENYLKATLNALKKTYRFLSPDLWNPTKYRNTLIEKNEAYLK